MSERPLYDYHYLAMAEDTLNNPHPFFARLRKEAPVFQEPDYGVYLVTRYEDVAKVGRTPEIFSALVNATGPYMPLPASIDNIEAYRKDPESDKLFSNDPPYHTRYRTLMSRFLSPRRMMTLGQNVRPRALAVMEEFLDKGECEWVEDFANILPVIMVGELFELPLSVTQEFLPYFKAAFKQIDDRFCANPNGANIESVAPNVLEGYFQEELAARKNAPRGDFLSDIANARFDDGEEVPLHDLVKLCTFAYNAGGNDNTPSMMTSGAKILAERPDIQQFLRENPERITDFVEETLRLEPPALGNFRIVMSDTELSGVKIPRGAMVMMLNGSGNRDETVFEDPDTFKLDRPLRRILTFSQGPHTCLGAPFARLEGAAVFSLMVEKMKDLRISSKHDNGFRYLPSTIFRAVRELHLSFTPA